MSKIAVVARLTAAEGKVEEMEAALRSLIEAADTEAGCEVYSVSASVSEPGVYWFFELYTDDDAFAAHGRGGEMKAAMGALGGLLGGLLGAKPEITRLTPLAAKGLTF